MATRKAPTKKGTSKKSAAKKSARAAAKPPSKTDDIAGPIIIPNLSCIIACAGTFARCLQKGVDRATCEKRLRRCLMNCAGGGAAAAPDEG